ncbi:SusD/RagB family nutrient-binding outer membrane lipoprotein [Snuella lapsa]|uniref:SusD/RagB family nutrient-binding outer membrane lipoprotein n=1 Tax=Snuella lapsa TaxID=870481 RepID=A0ABP6YIW1_9FLAO
MKNNIIKKFIVIITLIFALGCSVNTDINTNPDGITSATPDLLASKLILDITRDDINRVKGFMENFLRDKYILWTEGAESEQYNQLDRADFNEISRLIETKKMMEALDGFPEGIANSYRGLAHFVRAYNFFLVTMKVGDIPYSEALKGEDEGIIRPKYDTQKDVFIGILKELDMADQMFANGSVFSGDMIYGGDPVRWRKMVNSFQLKVLMNLYRKTGDTDLKVVERFKDIVDNKPIFSSNEDNFSLVYQNAVGQFAPWNNQGNNHSIYPMVSSVLIDRLKGLNDYRLFYYATPSLMQISNGMSESDFDAYIGVNPALEYTTTTAIYSSGDYCDVNDRYKVLPEGEPVYLLSYAQVQFMIAEAAVRGWVSKNAEVHYVSGIKASMSLIAGNTPDNMAFHHGRIMDQDYIDNYYQTTPQVQLGGTDEERIEQIIVQKYLSNFLQSPNSSFFENRRTGYPVFEVNPSSNLNVPADKLPVRWMYPTAELEQNSDNVLEAINRQYNGNDNNNGVMWILQ